MQYPVVPIVPVARHRALIVEEANECLRVRHVRLGAQRAHQGKDPLARRFVPKRGALGQDRRPLGAVVGIDDQHRVPRFGEPPAHLLEGGPQAECIGPDQHTRMGAARGMDEVTVRRPVGRRHLDLRRRHLERVRGRRGKSAASPVPTDSTPNSRRERVSRSAQVVFRVAERFFRRT